MILSVPSPLLCKLSLSAYNIHINTLLKNTPPLTLFPNFCYCLKEETFSHTSIYTPDSC